MQSIATKTARVTMETATRQLIFRPGTSDEQVMQQMFTAQHLNLRRLARFQEIADFLRTMEETGKQPLIVDAGANMGASSVYLAMAFPKARVVAVEPEPGNFALLSKNVEGLNVHCLQAALAAHPGQTRIVDPGGSHWAYRTDQTTVGGDVEMITIPQIFAAYENEPYYPFIVKVDIEGGEKDLFSSNITWVERTPIMLVELHDWLFPKQGTARPFIGCVAALDRDFVHIGETVFSIDNSFSQQHNIH